MQHPSPNTWVTFSTMSSLYSHRSSLCQRQKGSHKTTLANKATVSTEEQNLCSIPLWSCFLSDVSCLNSSPLSNALSMWMENQGLGQSFKVNRRLRENHKKLSPASLKNNRVPRGNTRGPTHSSCLTQVMLMYSCSPGSSTGTRASMMSKQFTFTLIIHFPNGNSHSAPMN